MDMDGAMTLNRLEALLAVYSDGITDMQDLRNTVDTANGISKSALSRMVSWWSAEAYLQYKLDAEGNQVVPDRPEGMGFLDITPDPRDYRRRVISVTPEGDIFGSNLADGIIDSADSFRKRWKEFEKNG
jgi:hypothetical protein